jgi:hypothetical protein
VCVCVCVVCITITCGRKYTITSNDRFPCHRHILGLVQQANGTCCVKFNKLPVGCPCTCYRVCFGDGYEAGQPAAAPAEESATPAPEADGLVQATEMCLACRMQLLSSIE